MESRNLFPSKNGKTVAVSSAQSIVSNNSISLTDNREKSVVQRMLATPQSQAPIQLVKVEMPDGSEVDTDYMSVHQLETAMATIKKAQKEEHWASPAQRSFEINYNKLSQARLQQSFGQHLMVGEGDFGFAHSQSKKQSVVQVWHPPVLGTEFRDEETLEQAYPDTFMDNVSGVEQHGGSVQYEVNAMKLSESFPRTPHFPMITSMFPNTGSRNRATQGPLTRDVVGGMFSEAPKFQEPGDRLYLTVPASYESSTRHRTYGMDKAAPQNDYELVNKFKFNPLSHPPYEHKMTKKDKSAHSMEDEGMGTTYTFLKKGKGTKPAYDSDFETDDEPEDLYSQREEHS